MFCLFVFLQNWRKKFISILFSPELSFPVLCCSEQMIRRKWFKLIYLQIDISYKALLWVRLVNSKAALPIFHPSNSKPIQSKTHSVKTLVTPWQKYFSQYVEYSFDFLICDADITQSQIKVFSLMINLFFSCVVYWMNITYLLYLIPTKNQIRCLCNAWIRHLIKKKFLSLWFRNSQFNSRQI